MHGCNSSVWERNSVRSKSCWTEIPFFGGGRGKKTNQKNLFFVGKKTFLPQNGSRSFVCMKPGDSLHWCALANCWHICQERSTKCPNNRNIRFSCTPPGPGRPLDPGLFQFFDFLRVAPMNMIQRLHKNAPCNKPTRPTTQRHYHNLLCTKNNQNHYTLLTHTHTDEN